MSNLDVLVQSTSESCAVRRGIESVAVPRAGDSEDSYRSQSITLQGCSADIGWGQRRSGTAHCHSSPGAALGGIGGRLRAHCEVWEISHGCCRLDGCHSCCGPVLAVTRSCKWEIKITQSKPLFMQQASTQQPFFLPADLPVLTALRA